MATINGKALVKDGKPLDRVYSNGQLVYGRNLLLKSQKIGFSVGFNGSVQYEKIPYDSNTNMWHITAAKGSGINVGLYFLNQFASSTPLTKGQKAVFGYDIKGVGIFGPTGIESADDIIRPTGSVPSDWTRVSASGTVSKDNSAIILYFNSTNSNIDVYIKLPKLEIGNTPTDWTPAPEDYI